MMVVLLVLWITKWLMNCHGTTFRQNIDVINNYWMTAMFIQPTTVVPSYIYLPSWPPIMPREWEGGTFQLTNDWTTRESQEEIKEMRLFEVPLWFRGVKCRLINKEGGILSAPFCQDMNGFSTGVTSGELQVQGEHRHLLRCTASQCDIRGSIKLIYHPLFE